MTTDPEAFYAVEERYRSEIRRLLEPLTDAELEQVYDQFHRDNLIAIPYRYHTLTSRVRAHVKQEQKRRMEQTPNE